MSKYLTTHEVAELLRLSKRTLDNWRTQKTGPTWTKAGGRILYDTEDIKEWIESQKRKSTR